ncbi:hypothetical protein [Kribbella solani]|uniref:Uncharacterized protein n=1 Tax=Kribbella solani TaxID=236067 RepID=A0A841DZW6_9ACTN|nr:hypothetical protein [Kribbella solani]MBB5981717.1 hypothetical protein [Kribbella solani]
MSKELPMCPCCSFRAANHARPHCHLCIKHPEANPRLKPNKTGKPGKAKPASRNRIW